MARMLALVQIEHQNIFNIDLLTASWLRNRRRTCDNARILRIRSFDDRQQAAPRRHDDIHRDVATRGGTRRHQSVAGVSRFRRSAASARARRRTTLRTATINTRRCRASPHCASRSRAKWRISTTCRSNMDTEVTDHRGRDGSDLLRDHGGGAPRRRSHRLRSRIRLLRAGGDAFGRRHESRAAARRRRFCPIGTACAMR